MEGPGEGSGPGSLRVGGVGSGRQRGGLGSTQLVDEDWEEGRETLGICWGRGGCYLGHPYGPGWPWPAGESQRGRCGGFSGFTALTFPTKLSLWQRIRTQHWA